MIDYADAFLHCREPRMHADACHLLETCQSAQSKKLICLSVYFYQAY